MRTLVYLLAFAFALLLCLLQLESKRWADWSGSSAAVPLLPRSLADSAPAPPPLRDAGGASVFFSYSVGGGLCNQLNSHLNALVLAYALGVDGVIMPPAWSRHSFDHGSGLDGWRMNETLGSLLDLEAMREVWHKRGIQLLEQVRGGTG